MSANYFRREYKNMSYTTNLAVPLTAYDLVNIADPRGNGQMLPIYNLQRAYLGLVNELDTTSPNNWRHYNGVDFTVNARGSNGMSVAGGVSVGRSVANSCDVGDPNQLRFCDQTQYDIPLAQDGEADLVISAAVGHPLQRRVPDRRRLQHGDAADTAPRAESRQSHAALHLQRDADAAALARAVERLGVPRRARNDHDAARHAARFGVLEGCVSVGRFRLTPQVDVFNLPTTTRS